MWRKKQLANPWWRNKRQMAVALLLATVGGAWSGSAWAALDIRVEKQNDGTGSCPLDTDPNNGVLCTNEDARYKVDYQVDPPPAAQSDVTITMTIPAGEAFRFSASSPALAVCRNGAAAISGDGRSLNCLLAGTGSNPVDGPIANQSGTIFFDVRASGDAKNGDTLAGVTGQITSAEDTTGATKTAPGVAVVAKPNIDLKKTFVSFPGATAKPSNCSSSAPTGSLGAAVVYRVVLNVNNVLGHEALAPGWSYVDNLTSAGADACVYRVINHRQYAGSGSTLPPGGDPAARDAGTGAYSFAQMGSNVTITSSDASDPLNVPLTSGEVVHAIDGMSHATAIHYVYVWVPESSLSGCFYTPSNTINSFAALGLSGVANDSDDPANNTATTTAQNICSGSYEKLYYYNSKGKSLPVAATDTVATRMSNERIAPGDFVDSYVVWSNRGLVPDRASHCDIWDNRKLQLDLLDVNLYTGGLVAPTPAQLTNNRYRWKRLPTAPNTRHHESGYAHIWTDSPNLTGNAGQTGEIEFGLVGYPDFHTDETVLRDRTCNDGESTLAAVATAAGVDASAVPASGWITQTALETNPHLVPFINATRMLDVNVPAGGRFQLFTHLKALPLDPAGNPWPDGSILPNYGHYQTTTNPAIDPSTGNWAKSTSAFMGDDPQAILVNAGSAACRTTSPSRYCDDGYSDRLRLASETISVRKGIKGSDPVGGPTTDSPEVPATKGQIVTYQLWPSLTTTMQTVAIDNDVVLIDTLPAGTKFVPGSLVWNGATVPAADFHIDDQSSTYGASRLTVILPGQVAQASATPIAPVEFQAEILLDAPGNVPNTNLVNYVEVRGCAPGASVDAAGALTCTHLTAAQRVTEREAKRTVKLAGQDGLVVQKAVIGGNSKQVGSKFTMALRYMNVGAVEVDEHRLVDILSYNGEPNRGNPDPVNDATRYSGTNPVTEVRAPADTGYKVYYTTDDPTTINSNPKCPSNYAGNVGSWPNFAPGVPAAAAGCAANSGATNWILAIKRPGTVTWELPPGVVATALLFKDETPFPSGAPSRMFEFDFESRDSRDGDRYANNFSGAHGSAGTALTDPTDPSSGNGAGASFSTTSNNVTVRVFASAIRGTVFVDPDGNGGTTGFDPTVDTGLGGVTVTLMQGGNTVRTAVSAVANIPAGQFYNPATGAASATDGPGFCLVPAGGLAAGQYLFCDIPAGDYSVVQTQPAGYTTTGNRAGTAGGTVSGDTISAITLPAGTTASGYDFGENASTAPTVTTVSGRVYEEGNGNTSDDGNATDPGIANVTVTLTYTPPGGGAPVTLTTTTGPDGSYSFNVPVGATNVTITQTQPPGRTNAYNTPGTGGTDGGNTATTSVITLPSVPAGGVPGNNFAEQPLPPGMTSVSGRVYEERNGNTSDDGNATDPGIANVTVTLTYTPPGGGAPVTLTTTTGPDGSYSFNVPVGATNVTITQTQPPGRTNAYNTPGAGGTDGGHTATTSVITLPSIPAGGVPGNNFAESPSGGIGGMSDMTSHLACTPPGAVPGTPISCTLTCTNNGPDAAVNATCGFTSLPPGVTVTCTPPSPQASLAAGASIVCTTSTFPTPSTPLILQGGTGADNDTNGGSNPAQGNNASLLTLGVSGLQPVPTLGFVGLLMLAFTMMLGSRRRRF